jgi:hypothetical protein
VTKLWWSAGSARAENTLHGAGANAELASDLEVAETLLAELPARAAILEKRTDLEQTIKELAEPHFIQMGPGSGKSRTLLEAIRVPREQRIIDDRTSALLRVIGNQAAHEPQEPTVNNKVTALRFGKLVDTLIGYLTILS